MFKAIINDIKTDIKAIKIMIDRARKGEPQLDPEKKQQFIDNMKGIRPKDFLDKATGMYILLIIFAGVVGWILAAKYYQVQCNNLIIDTYITPQLAKAGNKTLDLIMHNFTG